MTGPLILATRNEGKLRELRPLFAEAELEVVDLRAVGLAEERPDEESVEAFHTFAENALAKARYFSGLAGGRPTVADDSGLEVIALGGAPGVWSRRWAAVPGLVGAALDTANNERLVRELAGAEDRRARFVCAAAYHDGARSLVRLGTVNGTITESPAGSQGFGYDPYFLATALGKTFAEASVGEKQEVSHRAAAFRALVREVRGGN